MASAQVAASPEDAPAEPKLTTNSGAVVAAQVVLSAHPLDSNHQISAVRFMLDGTTLAECGPPGRYVWDTTGLRPGRHVVQVQAFENTRFIGLSEPFVVYVASQAAPPVKTFAIPFFTYEFDPRRTSGIVAPRLVQNSGSDQSIEADGSQAGASSRLASASVEIYLNGVRQEFAPAARIASADELAPVKNGQKNSGSPVRQPKSNHLKRHNSRYGTTHKPSAPALAQAPSKAMAQRTVWMPARPLLEKLGARVSWKASEQTLIADLNVGGVPRRIILSAARGHSAQAEIGGQRVALEAPVSLADNVLMVPLSFCREALDLRVRWQKEARRVEMFTAITPA